MGTLHLINGPNLNRLGTREPAIYGAHTLHSIEEECRAVAAERGFSLIARQSNSEGELVTFVHQAIDEGTAGVMLNAGAYTHTSIALADALRLLDVPAVEVHLSNTHRREAFRHHSALAPVVTGVIMGFGHRSYRLATLALCELAQAGQA